MSELRVDTLKSKEGTSTAMTIGSTGIISEPNRPCFHVTKNTDQTINDVE